MTLFPRHPLSRIVAVLWALACLAIFAAALLRPDLYANQRTALAGLVPVYFLSFPLGHAAVMACIRLKLALYLEFDFVPGILSECVFLWCCMTVLGYVQWFVLLPWLTRRCWRLSAMLFNRRPN